MTVYVYDEASGRMVDKVTGEPMIGPSEVWRPVVPHTWSDMEGYRSPIDGAWIEGRRARRYDLESNNCVDANDLPKVTDEGLRNKRFAKKHGLTHMLREDLRD